MGEYLISDSLSWVKNIQAGVFLGYLVNSIHFPTGLKKFILKSGWIKKIVTYVDLPHHYNAKSVYTSC